MLTFRMGGVRELKSNDRFRKLASLPSTKGIIFFVFLILIFRIRKFVFLETMKSSEKNRPLPRPSKNSALKSNEVVHTA